MSFVRKIGGTTLWSAINIDTDKNMLTFGMENLKELCASMVPGDIIAFDQVTGRLAAVHANIAGTQLITKGTTWPPVWGFPDSGDIGWTTLYPMVAGSDDSEGSGGVYNNAAGTIRVGNNGGSILHSAIRFTNINLPLGAIIYKANITFTAQASRAAQAIGDRFYGEAAAAPATYGAAENFTLRTRTLHYVPWAPATWVAETEYISIDISQIVQELANAYGPYVNGAMAFQWINYLTAATNFQNAYSYDTDPTKAPVLSITYGEL